MSFELDYEIIQVLEETTTRKLIKYINEFLQREKVLDTVEFYYPDHDEQKAKMAFNVWISIDYRTNQGKSFIEHMLEERASSLTKWEKDILIERNKSHVSLFEIEKIMGNNIHLFDLLTRKRHVVWEPYISSTLNPSDLIFGRIGKIINYKGFIGNISFLPSNVRDMFLGEVLIDFNRIRLGQPNLSIDEYLKDYSLNVYRIYTDCYYEVLDESEINKDIISVLYDELDDFEAYLALKEPPSMIKKHITNIMDLFEYYFMSRNLFLQNFKELTVKKLVTDAIKDGFIFTKRDFISHILTLRKYLRFLKNINPAYTQQYEEILEISENSFQYMQSLREINPPFSVDMDVVHNIYFRLNNRALSFISDYEKFLSAVFANEIEVTEKRKYIKKKYLMEINDSLANRQEVKKAVPNQKDFPLIHLFYLFSIYNGIMEMEENTLVLTSLGHSFKRLCNEEQLTAFIQYLWDDDFLVAIGIEEDFKSIKEDGMKILVNLIENKMYDIETLNYSHNKTKEFLLNISIYLNLMGLLDYDEENPYLISLNSLGKSVLTILSKKDDYSRYNGKVLYLKR